MVDSILSSSRRVNPNSSPMNKSRISQRLEIHVRDVQNSKDIVISAAKKTCNIREGKEERRKVENGKDFRLVINLVFSFSRKANPNSSPINKSRILQRLEDHV